MEKNNEKNLRKGWTITELKNVGEIVTGSTPSKKKSQYYGNDFPFFKPTDLNKGYYVIDSSDKLSIEGMKKALLYNSKDNLKNFENKCSEIIKNYKKNI